MKEFDTIINAYFNNMFSRGDETVDVLELYKNLPDKSITNEEGKNLYHVAARFFDSDAIDLLAAEGVKPRTDDNDNTPLHDMLQSSYMNDVKNFEKKQDDIYNTVKKLIELKVNPKKKNESGDIAYYKAGKECMYPFIKALADSGIKMDAIGDEQKNLLHEIFYLGYYRKSVDGWLNNAIKTVRILLESGSIDPEDKDVYDTTPLQYAQRSDLKEIAALLSGEESASQTGGMTLAQAILQKDIDAAKAIIDLGADLNEISDEYNRTPLMLACEYPSVEAIQLLLENGADVNCKSGETGHTAVYYLITQAISNLGKGVVGGFQEPKTIKKILHILIDSGLDIDTVIDNEGNTALIYVCLASYLAGMNNSLAEELIDAGCDVNKANLNGFTPLMAFAVAGDEKEHNITELLLDNDADATLADAGSNTALMYAASNTNKISGKKIVELILDSNKDVDINKTNNKGETAVDIAVKNNNEAVVKLLLSHM